MIVTIQMDTFRGMMKVYDLAGIGQLQHNFTEDLRHSVNIEVKTRKDRESMRRIMAYIGEYLEKDDE